MSAMEGNFTGLNLYKKLLLSFLLAATLPISIIGGLSYFNGKASIIDQQASSLAAIIDSRVFDIELLIKLRSEQAGIISGNYLVRQLKQNETIDSELQELLKQHLESIKQSLISVKNPGIAPSESFISKIAIADNSGKIVVSTDSAFVGTIEQPTWQTETNQENPVFKGYDLSPAEDHFYLKFISPIKEMESNQYAGVVILYVNPGILNQITKKNESLGDDGEIILLSNLNENEGRPAIIAGLNDTDILNDGPVMDLDSFQNPGFFNRNEGSEIGDNQHGTDVLSIVREIPALNFKIIASVTTQHIFQPVYDFGRNIFYAVLILLALSLILASYLSRSITDPVKKLAQLFSSISKGEQVEPIQANRNDEIGSLFSSVNSSISYLNKKIEAANRISGGVFDIDVHLTGEKDELGQALTTMTRSLKKSRNEIESLINQLRRSNSQLAEQKAKLQSIFDSSTDTIITLDDKLIIQSVNPAGLATFVYTEKELIGTHADEILVEIPHSVMSSEKPVVRFQDTHGIKKDGSWFPLSFSMSYAEWDNQAVLVLIIRDLSERKKLERRVLKSLYDERIRIGEEIHEGLGQTLTGLHIITQNVAEKIKNSDHAAAQMLLEIAADLRKADRSALELYHSLVEVDLQDSGLIIAFKKLKKQLQKRYTLDIDMEIALDLNISDRLKAVHILIITREFVHLVQQTANPEKIEIRLLKKDAHVELSIEFKSEKLQQNQAEEMLEADELLKYRTSLMGGSLRILQTDDDSTLMICTIPVML
jgi:PAS domain S-box-containing protein